MSNLIYTGSSWNFDKLYRMMDACEEIAINDMGLDCFPNQLEIITVEQMLESTPDEDERVSLFLEPSF